MSTPGSPITPRVLVVDDNRVIRRRVKDLLVAAGFDVLDAVDGFDALERIGDFDPDVVVSDVSMPRVDGYELTRRIKEDSRRWRTQVILVTSESDLQGRVRAVNAGSNGFLAKPFASEELLAAVNARLATKRDLDELEAPEAVILMIAGAIEGRDDVTGGHCKRLSLLSVETARRMGLDVLDVTALERAGILHDIGKISVPDSILLKPGPLTDEERAVMELHTIKGEEIVRPLSSLKRVLPIIRSHHERQDGSGYPDGLRGEEIAVTARVLQVVDVYDALRTERPYKQAMSRAGAFDLLQSEADKGWWDPSVVQSFGEILDDFDGLLYTTGNTASSSNP